MFSKFKSYCSHQAGNVAIMLALGIVPICLSLGVAVDYGRSQNARTVLQGAADAAALAASTSQSKVDASLQKIVEDYLDANGARDVLQHVSEIKQELDASKGTFTVRIAGTIDSSFLRLVGFKEMDISARSVVNLGSQTLELALVLDNTGSMSGAKIANLKNAATTFVNILQSEASGYADIKIAVVPFAEYVNVGAANGGDTWIDNSYLAGAPFSGCVGSRLAPADREVGAMGSGYPALAGVPCNVELLPLTSNLDDVKSRIAAMVSTGYTYIPTGLMWGWNVLDSEAPFTEGRTSIEINNIKGQKVIVLMTDGENTISPSFPSHDGKDVAAANETLEDLCVRVKQDEIQVYTVAFMVPSDTIKDILTNCASTSSKYFDADNSTELNAAFSQIALELASIRLTQ